MKYYAIRNRQTKRLVSGTDYNKRCQIYADKYRPPLLLPADEGDDWFLRFAKDRRKIEFKQRGIKPSVFELVDVKIN